MLLRVGLAVALLATNIFCFATGQSSGQPQTKCTPPRPTYSPDPPLGKPRKNLSIASFELLVNENGEVAELKVLRSSGEDEFDKNAIKTLRTWKFEPHTCDGERSAARVVIQIDPRIRRSSLSSLLVNSPPGL